MRTRYANSSNQRQGSPRHRTRGAAQLRLSTGENPMRARRSTTPLNMAMQVETRYIKTHHAPGEGCVGA